MDNSETIVGGLGASGDTSCTDHIVAWKIRDALALDHTPNGLNPPLKGDNTILTPRRSRSLEAPAT